MTDAASAPAGSPARRLFCNRTLNFRSIRAIGYDMDYTLIQYHMVPWEHRAYEHARRRFMEQGWPLAGRELDTERIERGLVIDTELGNLLKVNRFGFVKKACHGTRWLELDEQRALYARTIVDLADRRYVFLNTFFSISEAMLYAHLVDLTDEQQAPLVLGYAELYRRVRSTLDRAHAEGQLKAEILADPEQFVKLDPETPLALLDQRHAGKKLFLLTNSDLAYSSALLTYAFDRYLPAGMTWRELFDLVIVSASKPAFFQEQPLLFRVESADGLLRPCSGAPLQSGQTYWGGNAALLEQHFGLSGDQILYVGDHLFADVQVTKNILRWRTALIVPDLEQELEDQALFRPRQQELERLMADKEQLEQRHDQLRLQRLRLRHKYGPPPTTSGRELAAETNRLRGLLTALDEQIAPLAQAAVQINNRWWGPLMRAGNDKSMMARQVEQYSDIYTSRVSNFLHQTPFVYLRSLRGSLPHDPG